MEDQDIDPIQRLRELDPIAAGKEFLELEAASGILLMVATVLALVCANTLLSGWYDGFLEMPVVLQVGALALDKPLLLWINDGLMAVFFFLIGLEVKREMLEGQLSDPKQVVLPGIAAIGGIVVPIGVYVAMNAGDPVAMNGWAIPAATDIAFALGVLALLGPRVPESLKVFLLVLAIIDDLAAILIIAVFFTSKLSVTALGLGLAALVGLIVMNRRGVSSPSPFVLLGIVMWVCILKSGIHATLAGVALAFTIPIERSPETGRSMLRDMEHGLHPTVAYAILPLFAFANAGIALENLSFDAILAPVPLGIFAGLFVGKQVGVFVFAALAIVLGFAQRPQGAGWAHLWGLAVLTGIGFTMSLFISGLAFQHATEGGGAPDIVADRLGILLGSAASAILGAGILWFAGNDAERA